MEFVALLSVFAITLTQVIARSIDTEDHLSTKDGCIGETDGVEALKFKLPTILKHAFRMTITGTLNITEENFTTVFPTKECDESLFCTLNFNYKSNSTIEASSSITSKVTEDYSIVYDKTPEPEFILELEAREKENGVKEMEMSFNGHNSGASTLVSCKVKSFEELDHIHFKEGVKNINSILFTF